jgi:hypothetical protein
MLNFNLVPIAFWRLGHSLEVNRGSLSDTMEIGIPCNLTTLFIYTLVNLSTESIIFTGRATITHIVSFRFLLFDSSVTKSNVMYFHFHLGIGKGCNPSTGI